VCQRREVHMRHHGRPFYLCWLASAEIIFSMSAPTKRLGKLSIDDDMPLTRAEAQRRASVTPAQLHKAPISEEESSSEEEEEEEEDEEEGEEDEPSLPLILRGASTIPYDVGDLSPIARSRADAGLRGDFALEQCRRTSSNDYEFRINERGRVRIGQTGTSCSCSEFSDGNACKHIYVGHFRSIERISQLIHVSGFWIAFTLPYNAFQHDLQQSAFVKMALPL
jgi:hypothetical protein